MPHSFCSLRGMRKSRLPLAGASIRHACVALRMREWGTIVDTACLSPRLTTWKLDLTAPLTALPACRPNCVSRGSNVATVLSGRQTQLAIPATPGPMLLRSWWRQAWTRPGQLGHPKRSAVPRQLLSLHLLCIHQLICEHRGCEKPGPLQWLRFSSETDASSFVRLVTAL